MPLKPRRLLATSAAEDAWGTSEPLLFLGEWCKPYQRRHVWSRRDSKTARFHWDDGDKRRRDYAYLESLHRSLLTSLAECLNEFHRVDQSVRYWQIQLDPWLASYIGVVFDRWESLRLAFAEYGELELVSRAGAAATPPPYGHLSFIDQALSDEWNRSLHERIIRSEYSGQCVIRQEPAAMAADQESGRSGPGRKRQSVLGRIAWATDGFLGRCFRDYDVVFLGATFSLPALIRLNLALGQAPRLFLAEFAPRPVSASVGDAVRRAGLRLDVQTASRFEEFLAQSIVLDLPSSVVEHYPALRDRARGLAIKTKAIVTGGRHWFDEFAKVWFAEQVSQGVKLVITEHGGALPDAKEWFDFEVDIADAKTTWFVPYHPTKHRRLPPARLVGGFARLRSAVRPASASRYCSVILYECARWVHRVHLCPMASQWSVGFEMILAFHDALDAEVKEFFRVKPRPIDAGWNMRQRYSDILGPAKVLTEPALDRVFDSSRVIVCTYPQTTFSEAMASGVPTVLMYPEHLWDVNPVAFPLLDSLRSAKILFHEPLAAAAHINAIWGDPGRWWTSPDVIDARRHFQEMAQDLDGHWLEKWTAFLKGVV